MPKAFTFTSWPEISLASDRFLAALALGCEARGWNFDDLAGHISHESRFKPGAKASGATASGLIQLIDSEARKLGTTAETIRGMSAESQLPFVFRYFERYGRPNMAGADYLRAGFGNRASRWDAGPGEPLVNSRGQVVSPGTPEYDLNAALDYDRDGILTIGDLEAHWDAYRAKYSGKIRTVVTTQSGSGSLLPVALLSLGIAVYLNKRG